MTARPAGGFAGTVRWAVVPYSPRPPFRIYAGIGHEPITVADADTLIDAARSGGDADLSYVVTGKARPVLLLNDPPLEHHREVAALRLLRLSRLSADEARRVRAQEEELLLYLPSERFALPEESAVMVTALVCVHADAIGSGAPLGRLETAESELLGERLVRYYGLDVRLLLERRIRELAARPRG